MEIKIFTAIIVNDMGKITSHVSIGEEHIQSSITFFRDFCCALRYNKKKLNEDDAVLVELFVQSVIKHEELEYQTNLSTGVKFYFRVS